MSSVEQIEALIDRLGRPMSLEAYVEFLQEVLGSVEVRLDAARSDLRNKED